MQRTKMDSVVYVNMLPRPISHTRLKAIYNCILRYVVGTLIIPIGVCGVHSRNSYYFTKSKLVSAAIFIE